MKQEDWAKRLRNRLADYEEPAPADLWADIEVKLAQQAAPRRHSKVVPMWGRWAAAAAVFAGVLVGASYLVQEHENSTVGDGHGYMAEQTVQQREDSSTEASTIEDVSMKSQKLTAQLRPDETVVHQSVPSAEAFAEKTDVQPSVVQDEPKQEVKGQSVEQQPSGQNISKQQPSTKKQPRKQNLPSDDDAVRQLDQKIREYRQHQSRVGLGVYAANGFGNQMNANGVLMDPSSAANYNIGNYSSGTRGESNEVIYRAGLEERQQHYQPVSFGLAMNIPVSSRFSIATGVVYTRLRSDFTKEMMGSSIVTEQTLHYIGIPVAVQYQIWNYGGLVFYASAGGQIDYNVSAKAKTAGMDVQQERDRLQFSAQGGVGIQYNFIPQLGVYVEPGVKYYFDNGSQVSNFFKDKKTNFNLQIGFRFNLSNN